MAYWLCITNSDNWKIMKEKNVWGVSDRHKNTILRVKPNDKLVIYGIQEKTVNNEILEPRIYGIFEVVSDVYIDKKRIFKSKVGETFPNRVRIKPIYIPKKPLMFKPLIEKMEFIKNKKKWNTHLFGRAMIKISEKDYKTIEEELSNTISLS